MKNVTLEEFYFFKKGQLYFNVHNNYWAVCDTDINAYDYKIAESLKDIIESHIQIPETEEERIIGHLSISYANQQ